MLAMRILTVCLQRSARRLCSVTRSRVPKTLQTGLEIVRKFASPKHGAARLLNTPELLTAADRMEAVTGISASLLEELNDSLAVIDSSCIPLLRCDTVGLLQLFTRPWGQNPEMGAREIQTELANTVMSWADIKRGRDLFVPGLSSFNIPNAVNAVFEFHQVQVQSLLDPKPWTLDPDILCSWGLNARDLNVEEWRAKELSIWMSVSVCIINPHTLRTFGHFPALPMFRSVHDQDNDQEYINERFITWALRHAYDSSDEDPDRPRYPRFNHRTLSRSSWETVSRVLAMDRESPPFKHFVRYAAWWVDPANAHVLDELDRTRARFEFAEPRRWAQIWPEGGESMQPPMLLNRMRDNYRELERLRQLGPDVHYSHLDSLKDPTAEPSSAHALRVLRNRHTVAKVSKELNNCAMSYAKWVERGKYVLVAIVDATGKAKALAGYKPGDEYWSHEPVEKNNVIASEETCELFDDYLSMLTAWSRQSRPKPLDDDDYYD